LFFKNNPTSLKPLISEQIAAKVHMIRKNIQIIKFSNEVFSHNPIAKAWASSSEKIKPYIDIIKIQNTNEQSFKTWTLA